MATYVIGDLQGCLSEFEALLGVIDFLPGRDEVWLVGDLVNRGPDSLGTLRRVRALGDCARVVLGNHDLHFLAVFYGGHAVRSSDTLDELLSAPDVAELAAWLRCQPLAHHAPQLGWLMVHAGVPPQWTLQELMARAEEARAFYSGLSGAEFFAAMYGDSPSRWSEELRGMDRVRCIVNHLTRMRLIDAGGVLDFALKGAPTNLPPGLAPWFVQPRREGLGAKVAFGHWAALEGRAVYGADQSADLWSDPDTDQAQSQIRVAALDTGCVWGRALTALCLDTGKRSSVAALRNVEDPITNAEVSKRGRKTAQSRRGEP